MSKRIEDLTPSAQAKYSLFAGLLQIAGIAFTVVYTLRSTAEQQALFAQGRHDLSSVNALRAEAGLKPIGASDNVVVTNCDGVRNVSNHQTGNAFDLTFADASGNPYWPTDPEKWKELGRIGKVAGLAWGGDFTPLDKNGLGWDTDHFELAKEE